jgi:hypothetical protein
MGWYEAEAVPPNVLVGRAVLATGHMPCATKPPMPGQMCDSGGGEVDWLVSGGGGGTLTWMNISVPSDGMYDVTFWYHCGNNDVYGDKNCGGQTNPPTVAPGCRPHVFVVNGTTLPGAYHFPCFAGSWGIIRAATVSLPLKGGAMNSIKVVSPPPRDASNMDALQISPPGKGMGPLIKSLPDLTGM